MDKPKKPLDSLIMTKQDLRVAECFLTRYLYVGPCHPLPTGILLGWNYHSTPWQGSLTPGNCYYSTGSSFHDHSSSPDPSLQRPQNNISTHWYFLHFSPHSSLPFSPSSLFSPSPSYFQYLILTTTQMSFIFIIPYCTM
jgi:hypothetical protein